MYFKKVFIIFIVFLYECCAEEKQKKRGIFDGNYGINNHFENFGSLPYTTPVILAKPVWKSYQAISSAEIASAITAAKEANVHVMEAQQRVQMAKEAVINQQRIANQKQAHAALALQKAEAAAAAGRQEANAAATAVVLAQQRLAQAKADVAEQQRIAAEKESHAAAIIHKSATAAAAEIQRTEDTAAKVAAIQKSQARAALKHVTESKDEHLTATSAAVAVSSSNAVNQHPWLNAEKTYYIPQWG